ncbi:MAG TPA: uroporphyrinogen-III synthase [Nitrososphaeraceae archaeon]|nr:uroporphyrinogen-III synthase [Nitrososphaeraceae archaeon]
MKDKIIAITHSRNLSSEFSYLLNNESLRLVRLKTSEIIPNNAKIINEIFRFSFTEDDYFVFLSVNAVQLFFEFAKKINRYDDIARILNEKVTVVAIGNSTSNSLNKNAINVRYVPSKSSSEEILKIFGKTQKARKIVIPRSRLADDYLRENLTRLGYQVHEFYLYDVKPSGIDDNWIDFSRLLGDNKIDSLIFTSPSNVRFFFDIIKMISEDLLQNIKKIGLVISIGPKTSKELQKYGISFTESHMHSLNDVAELLKSQI